jgi:formate-dependent nitrite reductase membrane component NrfD
MSFWAVVFVVLMILALFGGGYAYRSSQQPIAYVGGWFMLWLCVAILGYIVLTGVDVGVVRVIR